MITQIGGYSMPLLVRSAEANIPEDVIKAMDEEAKKDFREAGRCLAFELPTACAYHTMRAVEKLVRIYYGLVTKKETDKIEWKTCTDELKRAGADLKTVQVLDQIRDLHRNPVAHPEIFVSMKEAQVLFNIAISVITATVEQIELLNEAPKAGTATA